MPKDYYQTVDEEDISVDNTAGGVRLTFAKVVAYPPPARVVIFVESAQIRYTLKPGEAPTSSAGEVLNPFDRLALDNMNEAQNFRAIRTGGTSANLRVKYQR